MQNQSLRLFLYSSLAIVALALVWGFRTIPQQAGLAEKELRSGLEQELIVLSSAVRASTSAMKYRLLDVLKAEGNDHTTRAFQDSPFVSSALLEWDSAQWKTLWHSSKLKEQFTPAKLRESMKDWPLSKIANEDAFFAKVADVDGQAYFALVVPVRRPSNTPMLGIGIFPAAQFGLTFSAEQKREVRVFDDHGFALALAHPAYLGTSVKREPIVAEILDGDAVSVRQEWKSERGLPLTGIAMRMADSNLFAAIETQVPLNRSAVIKGWIYLLLCAAGAIAMNWFLFASMIRPLLEQLARTEELVEKMRRQMLESPVQPAARAPAPAVEQVIPGAELPDVSFLEVPADATAAPVAEEPELPPAAPRTPLAKVVNAALRSLDSRLKENRITVNRIGLEDVEIEADVLQMQTAVEEVLKNAVEAMSETPERQLSIEAQRSGNRLQLTVEDTGCGIAPDNVKKVFDPFFSTKDSQGVARGLGLNVVRRVVEELQGTVVVENRQGTDGVRVQIEWPLDKHQATAAVNAPPSPKPALLSDLDLLNDEDLGLDAEDEFSAVPVKKANWPQVPIRKPKVRTLD